MASLGVEKCILRQINTNDVFEELKASNEISNAYKEMLISVKKTDAYKSLRNVAVDHISAILTTKKDTLLEASIQKRKQISEIRRMIHNIHSTISEKISERLGKEDSKIAVRKAIKRLSNKRQNITESNKRNPRGFQLEHKNSKSSRSIVEGEEDIFDLFSLSSKSSASSVNASDFSYFDDHISISSTDDDGEIRKRSISFATANKPFLQEGSPKTQKAKNQEVLGIEKDMDSKKTRSPKSAASKSALNAVTDARPTRTRKPNPKYYGEGMMLYSDE